MLPAGWVPISQRFSALSLKHLHPLFNPRHNNRPIRQQDDEIHLAHWPLDRVRKADEPKRNGRCPKFLSLQRPDLYVIKGRQEIRCDLCFLSGHGLCDLLLIDLEKRTSAALPITRASATA